MSTETAKSCYITYGYHQVTRSGREGSVHVEGDSVVEGRANNNNGSNGQLKVRRAPVYLGGAPPGAKHLPRPKLYRTGEPFEKLFPKDHSSC